MLELTNKNFGEETTNSETPVFVDFWADWCAPCRAIMPVIKEMSVKYADKMKFCKLNIDENQEIAQKYNITSIPTLMIFKNGEPVEQQIGGADIEGFINGVL